MSHEQMMLEISAGSESMAWIPIKHRGTLGYPNSLWCVPMEGVVMMIGRILGVLGIENRI